MKEYFKYFSILLIVIVVLFFSVSCTAKIDYKANMGSTMEVNSIQTVPLPSAEDIVRLFFNLINEKRIPEAIDLMTGQMRGDDTSKQAWGVQFNTIQSVKVLNIEPFSQEQWTDTIKTFKVTLEVSVSPESKDESIPYYGWDTNPAIRWITLKKDIDGLWKIDMLATGP